MLAPGCLPLILIVAFLFLLPFFFAQLMVAAMVKLGLGPATAFFFLVAIVLGGTINIPLKRIPRMEQFVVDPLAVFGFGQFFPRLHTRRSYTIIAVNVGGCLVPSVLALYQCVRIAFLGLEALLVLLFVTTLSIVVCYKLARPVPGVGIAMPALIPPLVAALPTLILLPSFAPPVAFAAGVLGPLIGADLLHLRDISKIATGMASIGGAGTFDGIVLGGLIATLLA